MLLSNALFLDEDYLQDCANKIDYLKYIKKAEDANCTATRPTDGSFIKISENLYKHLKG